VSLIALCTQFAWNALVEGSGVDLRITVQKAKNFKVIEVARMELIWIGFGMATRVGHMVKL